MTMLGVYRNIIDSEYIYILSGVLLAMIVVATVYYARNYQIKSLKVIPTSLTMKQSAVNIDFEDKDLESM